MRWVALAAVLLGTGCSNEDGWDCDLPMTTQYTCEPIPAGSYGCQGGPMYLSSRDHQLHQDDLSKTFPVPCSARVPDCSGFYAGSLRTFQCDGSYSEPPNDAGIDSATPPPAKLIELL